MRLPVTAQTRSPKRRFLPLWRRLASIEFVCALKSRFRSLSVGLFLFLCTYPFNKKFITHSVVGYAAFPFSVVGFFIRFSFVISLTPEQFRPIRLRILILCLSNSLQYASKIWYFSQQHLRNKWIWNWRLSPFQNPFQGGLVQVCRNQFERALSSLMQARGTSIVVVSAKFHKTSEHSAWN